MKDGGSGIGYAVALGGGALLWWATALVSGRTEAWDSSLYWMVAYPLSIGLAAGLGYRFPGKPWRWGLAVMWVQAVVLSASGAGFGLLPLGLVVFAVLAIPAVAIARMASGIRLGRGGA